MPICDKCKKKVKELSKCLNCKSNLCKDCKSKRYNGLCKKCESDDGLDIYHYSEFFDSSIF
jgi:hypothetical protein